MCISDAEKRTVQWLVEQHAGELLEREDVHVFFFNRLKKTDYSSGDKSELIQTALDHYDAVSSIL